MTKRLAVALTTALCLATPLSAEPDLGLYLAARHAGMTGDFAAAAQYFPMALAGDPSDPVLRENTSTTFLALGQLDRALPIAKQMLDDGQDSQLANLIILADAAKREDWDAIFSLLEAGHEVGPLVNSLSQAWAFVGKGQMDDAVSQFDTVIDTPGLRSFGLLHKAFALAIVGDLEGADAILSMSPQQGIVPSRDSIETHVNILMRLGAFDRAQALIDQTFGDASDPALDRLRQAVANQEATGPAMVNSPREGIAYTLLGLADVLQGEANAAYLLMYAQAAAYVDPDRAACHLAAARLLDELKQHDLAADTFAEIATDDPMFYTAELGRAESLRAAGRVDAAIEVLTQLSRSLPDLPVVQASLGDIYRGGGEFEKANAAYTAALSLYPEGDPAQWWVTYARGITNERLDHWPQAEADFRRALELNPGQPNVLNYLGYSMVEKGINLDEALAMIEQAATARPESGAIIDSLGWVLFKLGDYDAAVGHMEKAVELEPVDPVVTDHLGDVYWMVGREDEARFQWRRALSFDPEPEEATRMRRKLEVGLVAVMTEEGIAPSEIAYDRQ